MRVERYVLYEGEFDPVRRDDLAEWGGASDECIKIGETYGWTVGWSITKEDHPDYVGQYAMIPHRLGSDRHDSLFGWVPECDVKNLKERRGQKNLAPMHRVIEGETA